MKKTHVVLCLTGAAWGETAFGIHLARELHADGQRVVFFGNRVAAPLLRSLPFTCEVVTADLRHLFRLFLETYLTEPDIASIVLADARGTGDFLEQIGCDPSFLLNYGIPIVAVDTWSFSESGKFQDWFADQHRNVSIDWLPPHIPSLAPVPFVRPRGIPGACRLLPAKPASGLHNGKAREQFGIPASDHVVLLCTAHWQHPDCTDGNVDGARIAKHIPPLVGHYLHQVGPRVHLIHVGRSPWDLIPFLGERYHWVPPLPPDEFDGFLAGVDLLLSLNVTSTAIGKAIVCGIPILLLYNSCHGESLEEICSTCSFIPTPFVKQWIEESLPLYPFFAWPLGMWKFLSPVLSDNPYMRTMEAVEVLDETRFLDKCDGLLMSSDRRESLLHQQAQYVAQVSSLPRPAELMIRSLRGYHEPSI